MDERYNASVPREVIHSAELRELFVPTWRADFAALESYRDEALPPIECPITVFGGTEDHTLEQEALEAWLVQTSKECRLRIIEGGHLYLQSEPQQLIANVVEDIGMVPASPLAVGCG
jgi:medium-chain acyl-[acyl-carrier-protein] hydrolase